MFIERLLCSHKLTLNIIRSSRLVIILDIKNWSMSFMILLSHPKSTLIPGVTTEVLRMLRLGGMRFNSLKSEAN